VLRSIGIIWRRIEVIQPVKFAFQPVKFRFSIIGLCSIGKSQCLRYIGFRSIGPQRKRTTTQRKRTTTAS
jgi:hypothetical protein